MKDPSRELALTKLKTLIDEFFKEELSTTYPFTDQGLENKPLELETRLEHFAWILYVKPYLKKVIDWCIYSRERENYTYELTQANIAHLISWVKIILSCSYEQANTWINEIINNTALKTYYRSYISQLDTKYFDLDLRYGRRMGWYSLVRGLKPKLVVETGVHLGIGSCVISAALEKNMQEGFPGKYIGIDNNPYAGALFLNSPYKHIGEIIIGDSLEILRTIDCKIDLFISDSDHSLSHEAKEYKLVSSKLSSNSMILSDNAGGNTNLLDFANETNRDFLYFKEIPLNHMHKGAGIGVAWNKVIPGHLFTTF